MIRVSERKTDPVRSVATGFRAGGTVFAIAVALAGGAVGHGASVQTQIGPLNVSADAPETVGLADVLEVRVTAVGPADVAVRWPDVSDRWNGHATVGSRAEGPDVLDGQTGQLHARRFTLRLEPADVGPMNPGRFTFQYRSAAAGPEAAWQDGAIDLPTVAVTASPGSDDPRTMRPIPDLPGTEPEGWPSRGLLSRALKWAAAALMATIVTVAAVAALRKPAPPTPGDGPSPRDRAIDELETLRRAVPDAPAGVDADRQTAASAVGVVRRYLSDRYAVESSADTSTELLADAGLDGLGRPSRDALRTFLDAADERKFGPAGSNAERLAAVFALARAFLDLEP